MRDKRLPMWTIRSFLTSEADKPRYVFFVLVMAGIILSIPQLVSPMVHAHMDAYWRANWAAENFINNSWINTNAFPWLPFHPVVLGLPLYILNNQQLTPRLMTLIFSLSSVVLMFYYAGIIFTGVYPKRPAFWMSVGSAALYLVLPLRYYLSTQTLSEPIAMFFLLSVLILFAKDKPNFIPGLIILNIAEGIRYEFWFLLPFIWLMIIVNRDIGRTKKTVYVLSSALFIMCWLAGTYVYRGNAFSFVLDKTDYVHEIAPGNLVAAMDLSARHLSETVSGGGILMGSAGLLVLITRTSVFAGRMLLLIPVYFFLSLVVQVYAGTMEWFPLRYLYPVVIPGIPLLIAGIRGTARFISGNSNVYRIAAVWIICALALYNLVLLYRNPGTLTINTPRRNDLYEATENYIYGQRPAGKYKTIYVESVYDNWNYPLFEYFTNNHNLFVLSKDQFIRSKNFSSGNYELVYEKDSGESTDALKKIYRILFENGNYLILRSRTTL